jgi:integrase
MRRFAIYVSAMDPRTEVPAKGLLPCQYRRQAPFLYRAEDVERLIEATHRIAVKNPFNGASHATLIGLMAVTGMRVGEVIILDRDDVDLIHLAQQQGAAIGGKEAAGKIGRDLARAQVGEKEGFSLRAKRHFSV